MTTHKVKSWTEFYDAIKRGQPFDVRADDRHYKVGDVIVFQQWDTDHGRLTGDECKREVTHVVKGVGAGGIAPLRGLRPEYVVLGLKPVF